MKIRTLSFVLILMTTVAFHAPPAAMAASSNDVTCYSAPCADTACETGAAYAAAKGTWWAETYARSGAYEHSQTAASSGWSQHASAESEAASIAGDSYATADGRGGNNVYSQCDAPGVPGSAATLPGVSLDALAVRCIADERITQGASFLGELHLSETGGTVLLDRASGMGLSFPTLKLAFHGGSLDALAQVPLVGLHATGLHVALDLANADGASCIVRLF